MSAEPTDSEFALLRHRMVDEQLCARNIGDKRVLAVMEKVPRHLFVPAAQRRAAHEDGPLPIGLGQTISQPYMVARMTELLRIAPTDRVLEIGTGSGYQTAVLAELAGEVWSVERHAELARRAEALLRQLGYDNVQVIAGDGSLGFPEAGPYDGIMVTAAAPYVPKCLLEQLRMHGRMVIPVTVAYNQDLRLIEKLPGTSPPSADRAGEAPGEVHGAPEAQDCFFRETSILGCTFVPLIGEQGYQK
jgi:protein-L-isoaspartate(D-aspartate) O-methyltransferase